MTPYAFPPPPPTAPISSSSPPPPPRPPRRQASFRLIPSIGESILGLLIAAGLVLAWVNDSSGTGAVLRVEDHVITATVDAFSGKVRVDETPGYRLVRPFLEDIYNVEKSPIEYRMTGNERVHDNLVPRLSVRASDGSNVWFDDVRIQYGVRPERAWDVISTAGGEYAWHRGILDAYARAALREALGVYTAEDIMRPESLRNARVNAQERLNLALQPHGLVVMELTSGPASFPKSYESVVQRRQIAEQEALKVDQEIEQIQASRSDRLAKLERDKALALTRMRSKLANDLAAAHHMAFASRKGADRAFDARVAAGERERSELLSRADSAVTRYTAEAEGIAARAEALAAKGKLAIRKALVESLKTVKFEIAPVEPLDRSRAQRAAAR
ncbi:MAG: SPFH domain-containing protein [Planctomycetota bacterium]